MNKLVIVRHGDKSSSGSLSDKGNVQIRNLAKKLIEKIEQEPSLIVLSSTSVRCIGTAQILVDEAFGGTFNVHEDLNTTTLIPNFRGILNLINSVANRFKVVVLVTHFECTENIPVLFCEEVLKWTPPSTDRTPRLGEAWIIEWDDEGGRKITLVEQ